MTSSHRDDHGAQQSSIQRAYQWVSRILSVAIGMIAPGLVGHWLDQRLGSLPWLTLGGFAFGLWYGIWRLIQITKPTQTTQKPSTKD